MAQKRVVAVMASGVAVLAVGIGAVVTWGGSGHPSTQVGHVAMSSRSASAPVTPGPSSSVPTTVSAPAPVPTTAPSSTTARVPTTVKTPTLPPSPAMQKAAADLPPSPPSMSLPSTSLPSTLPPITYTVKPGDSLSTIAAWFKLHGYAALYQQNAAVIGANPNRIFAGQKITIASGVMTFLKVQ